MIFNRMDHAINYANIETSTPEQFALSIDDYAEFLALPHPHKNSGPITFNYRGLSVIEASGDDAYSVLHVVGNRPIFENPIKVK